MALFICNDKAWQQSHGAVVLLERAVEGVVVADTPSLAQRDVALAEHVCRCLGLAGTREEALLVAVHTGIAWLWRCGSMDCYCVVIATCM